MKNFLVHFIIFSLICLATYSYPDYCSTEKFYPFKVRRFLRCRQSWDESSCGIRFFDTDGKVSKRQVNSYRDGRFFSLFSPFLSSLNRRQFYSNQPVQYYNRQPQQINQRQPTQISNRFSINQQPQSSYGQSLNVPQPTFSIQQYSRPQQYSNNPVNSNPQTIVISPSSQSSTPIRLSSAPGLSLIISIPNDPIANKIRHDKWDEEHRQIEADRKRDRYPNWDRDVERQHQMDLRSGVVRNLDIQQYINSLPKNSVLYEMMSSSTKAAYYKGIPTCEDHLLAPLRLYQLSLGRKHEIKSFQRPDGTRARFEFNSYCPEACENTSTD